MEHHAMKWNTGVEVWSHIFSTSALGEGEWSVSCPGHFTTRQKIKLTIEQKAG
jgi:hypothetical protein